MAFYSRRLFDSMITSSYDITPKTVVMEAWELVNSPGTNSITLNATTLLPFNREEFTKNAEVCLNFIDAEICVHTRQKQCRKSD